MDHGWFNGTPKWTSKLLKQCVAVTISFTFKLSFPTVRYIMATSELVEKRNRRPTPKAAAMAEAATAATADKVKPRKKNGGSATRGSTDDPRARMRYEEAIRLRADAMLQQRGPRHEDQQVEEDEEDDDDAEEEDDGDEEEDDEESEEEDEEEEDGDAVRGALREVPARGRSSPLLALGPPPDLVISSLSARRREGAKPTSDGNAPRKAPGDLGVAAEIPSDLLRMLNQTYRTYYSTAGGDGSPGHVSSNSKDRASEQDPPSKKAVATSSPTRARGVCKELLRAVSSDSEGSASPAGVCCFVHPFLLCVVPYASLAIVCCFVHPLVLRVVPYASLAVVCCFVHHLQVDKRRRCTR